MSVLHLGGRPLITQAILQIADQHRISYDYSPLETPLNAEQAALQQKISLEKLASYPIILFHRLESLKVLGSATNVITAALRQLKESSKLFFYSYDEYCEQWNAALAGLINEQHFNKIFLGSPQFSEALTSWCSLPCALQVHEIEPRIREPRAQQLHLLYLANPNLEHERVLIEQCFAQLRAKGLRFSSAIINAQDVNSLHDLDALVSCCDLFIEQVQRPYFGSLAVYAMAKGKPVVSGNDPSTRNFSFHYSLSPVLAASTATLLAKLEAIIREPICLRDLSKRSRQYAETYHNADLLYGQLLDLGGEG